MSNPPILDLIHVSDLKDTPLAASLECFARRYSIPISISSDLTFGGSGTLVQYKNIKGILTATHVVTDAKTTRKIFSPLIKTEDPELFHSLEISIKGIIYIESEEGFNFLEQSENWPEGTLDICLIEITEPFFKLIIEKSGKDVLDLLACCNKYHLIESKYWAPENNSNWLWGLYGFPREDVVHDQNKIAVSKFPPFLIGGGTYCLDTHNLKYVNSKFINETADLGFHKIKSNDSLPEKFSGISGGGVWQFTLRRLNDNSLDYEEVFFAGVVIKEEEGFLCSRGPISLYDIFVPYLESVSKKESYLMDSE